MSSQTPTGGTLPAIPELPAFLDPVHSALAQQVEQFAAASIAGSSETEESDYVRQARTYLRLMAERGLVRYTVPGAYGGMLEQVDVRSLCLIRRGLSYVSALADAMFAMQGLGSHPITLAGSDAMKQRVLPNVASGKCIAAFAVTEPQAGSDAAGIQTVAVRQGNSYVLNGSKRFISNAGIADFYVVFAKTNPSQGRKGISGFLVERDNPGLTKMKPMELIAPHPIGEFTLEDCRVPAENLLGVEGDGFSLMMRTLETFRTTVGAAALGLAERALQEAVSYAHQRVQFGKPLADFQGLRFMLGEMATEVEASRLLVFHAASRLDQSRSGGAAATARSSNATSMSSSMAKFYATEAAQRVIDHALQIHGGIGVVKGTVVERLYREIRALRVYEGTTEIQKEIISRHLLHP